MDLLEYQAKALFAENGIPILPSQQIASVSDIRHLKIPYPVMLKSQVRAQGRGRSGGVRMATNTVDAVAAAQSIFRLPIRGQCPKVLLAEAHYKVQRELYLAVILDHNARRPLLLGAASGGMDADLSPEQVAHVLVEEDFSPFYVRRLALSMGLRGALMRSVALVAERMYRLFVQRDLDLVEINPLGVGADGMVMALDGKVRVNDNALERHPMLLQMLQRSLPPGADSVGATSEGQNPVNPPEKGDRPQWTPMNGNVSVVCNGRGLTLATVDWVMRAGGQAAGFADVGWTTEGEVNDGLGDRLLGVLEAAIASSEQPTVLVNLVGPAINGAEIVRQLVGEFQRRGYWPASVASAQNGVTKELKNQQGNRLEFSPPLSSSLPSPPLSKPSGLMSDSDRVRGTQTLLDSPTIATKTGIPRKPAIDSSTAPLAHSSVNSPITPQTNQRKFDRPSSPLNLEGVQCQRRCPRLVIHCSDLNREKCESLVEPYPIWIAESVESAVKLAVDISALAEAQ
ncbi:MAG: ATP-grasp domain-containing protein [Cyanophyceae cyanobacterium]